MTFTIYEQGTHKPIAQVNLPSDKACHVQERPPRPSRLPADPLPIPPPGFIVINQREAEIFGLGR